MDTEGAAKFLRSLSPKDKARTYAGLCHHLTVIARDAYGSGENVAYPGRLRALNEIQHHMTGFLLAAMDGDAEHCPDQAIATMFFADREDTHVTRLLAFAFESVRGWQLGRR